MPSSDVNLFELLAATGDVDRVARTLDRALRDLNAGEPQWTMDLSPPVLAGARGRQALDCARELLEIFYSLCDRLFGGDFQRFGEWCGYPPADIDLMRLTYRGWDPNVLARWDAMLTDRGAQFIELNIGGTVGGMNFVKLERPFFAVDAFREPLAAAGVVQHDVEELWRRTVYAMLDPGPERALRQLAMVEDPASYDKLPHVIRQLTAVLSDGVRMNVELCSADELSYRDGRVALRERVLDGVYRLFTGDDVLARPELYRELVAAVAAGTLAIPMGVHHRIIGNKLLFGLVCSPEFQAIATPAERALVERHVPPTWRLSAETAELCASRREELVIKPAGGAAGADVFCGWTMTDDAWRAAIARALAGTAPFIMQQRAGGAPEPHWLGLPDGRVERHDCNTVAGIFVCGGQAGGGFTRSESAGADGVINLSRGAALGPLLIVA